MGEESNGGYRNLPVNMGKTRLMISEASGIVSVQLGRAAENSTFFRTVR